MLEVAEANFAKSLAEAKATEEHGEDSLEKMVAEATDYWDS